jgi:hypothetical protein
MTEAVDEITARAEETVDEGEAAPVVSGRPTVLRIRRTAFVSSLVWVIFDKLMVYVQLFA